MRDSEPGEYVHFKGGRYRVLALADDSSDRGVSGSASYRPQVVYASAGRQSLAARWCLRLASWLIQRSGARLFVRDATEWGASVRVPHREVAGVTMVTKRFERVGR